MTTIPLQPQRRRTITDPLSVGSLAGALGAGEPLMPGVASRQAYPIAGATSVRVHFKANCAGSLTALLTRGDQVTPYDTEQPIPDAQPVVADEEVLIEIDCAGEPFLVLEFTPNLGVADTPTFSFFPERDFAIGADGTGQAFTMDGEPALAGKYVAFAPGDNLTWDGDVINDALNADPSGFTLLYVAPVPEDGPLDNASILDLMDNYVDRNAPLGVYGDLPFVAGTEFIGDFIAYTINDYEGGASYSDAGEPHVEPGDPVQALRFERTRPLQADVIHSDDVNPTFRYTNERGRLSRFMGGVDVGFDGYAPFSQVGSVADVTNGVLLDVTPGSVFHIGDSTASTTPGGSAVLPLIGPVVLIPRALTNDEVAAAYADLNTYLDTGLAIDYADVSLTR